MLRVAGAASRSAIHIPRWQARPARWGQRLKLGHHRRVTPEVVADGVAVQHQHAQNPSQVAQPPGLKPVTTTATATAG